MSKNPVNVIEAQTFLANGHGSATVKGIIRRCFACDSGSMYMVFDVDIKTIALDRLAVCAVCESNVGAVAGLVVEDPLNPGELISIYFDHSYLPLDEFVRAAEAFEGFPLALKLPDGVPVSDLRARALLILEGVGLEGDKEKTALMAGALKVKGFYSDAK